jgi:hypothetical protein
MILALGIRGLRIDSRVATLMAVTNIAAGLVAILAIGFWAIIVVPLMAATTVVVIAIRLALDFDRVAASCTRSVYGPFADRQEARRFIRNLLRSDEAFQFLGAQRTALLVKRLCERKRNANEITLMAPPVARLAIINDHDEIDVADKIDLMLRRWGKSAEETPSVADTLTASAQRSPSTFAEMLTATTEV